ncbi:RNA chaperone Hfq [Lacicoccus qingdaonensis]|uniref:RNA-binding protein Hfq n=1 Tax=Lacicoccus qingdaonensis TaxID=576118 RepID=A0A1G9ACY3_9BACL|nr:RNA chaperone Hfq [Salinicoccus qingdaonensis]SDK25247.1 RNA-binding protein Hfq [Salinicoccus qingdaonensis]
MSNLNLQDEFLNDIKDADTEVTVILQNGYQMKGKVKEFDKYVIKVESGGKTHLIYKHAISTFVKQ